MSVSADARQYQCPNGMDLGQWMTSRVASRATRRYDWEALKFQADCDPKYARAQMRYIGTGATDVASDENTVPAEHFTFSTMILPVGAEGPLHLHTDAEEVFFVLRGRVRLMAELNGDLPAHAPAFQGQALKQTGCQTHFRGNTMRNSNPMTSRKATP